MKDLRAGALGLMTAALFTACASSGSGTAEGGGGGAASKKTTVSAYIRTWQLGADAAGGYWTAGQIPGQYLTDLILAFALIDPADGSSLYIKDQDPSLWDQVSALKAEYPDLSVHISVGGYTGSNEFSDMAADPAKRAAFTANVVKWLREHNLDGADIDWEYPVGPDWGQEAKSSPADRGNFITLLKELRAALDALGAETGKRYQLSAAIPASNWYPQKNDVVQASKICDSLKLMAYDYYGAWMKNTGHAANLRRNTKDPSWGGWSTDQAVRAYLDALVPPGKIVLGVSLYGQGWTGVPAGDNPATPGLYQSAEGSIPAESLSWPAIKELLETPGYTRYWDEAAQAPYLYNGDSFITYTDGEAIGRIKEYAAQKKLAGFMVWEAAFDLDGELIGLLSK